MRRQNYELEGGHLSALHFGDVSQPIRLVFLHANGFNAQTYRAVLEPLAVHSVALDLRGHGVSSLPYNPTNLKNWHPFRDDVLQFIKSEIQDNFILSGHSLGACVGMLCAPFLKGQLKAYVGFDPVTLPIWMQPLVYIPGAAATMRRHLPIAAAAGRRRDVFESLEQAFTRYQGRGVFKRFSDDVLRDYLEGGLRETEDGVKLACDPKWEQAIYAAQGHNLFKGARSLPENSRVIFAGKGAPHTPTARERMRGIVGKENVDLQKSFGHMFPLTHPEFATQAVNEAIGRAGF